MKISIVIACFLSLMVLIYASCSHSDIKKQEKKISKNGETESHHNGENCMNCHYEGGNGEGWFAVAGSVYKSDLMGQNPNGKIYFYTQSNGNGDLKYTLEVDSEGNFYSTETLNFGSGLYPVHQNKSGALKFMASPILNGQCNMCHNASVDKIWNE